jgi:hypothetical protein
LVNEHILDAFGGLMHLIGSILYGADELVARMVAARIPHVGAAGFGPCRSLGVVRGDRLLGGVVFHNFKGATMEVSGAFDRADWIRPATLRPLFAYPFLTAGCRNLLTVTPRRNWRARKLDEFLGFEVVGSIIGAYESDDAILYQMPREKCRWLKGDSHGK